MYVMCVAGMEPAAAADARTCDLTQVGAGQEPSAAEFATAVTSQQAPGKHQDCAPPPPADVSVGTSHGDVSQFASLMPAEFGGASRGDVVRRGSY